MFEVGMRKLEECDMEEFGTLDGSDKAIATLEIYGGRRRRNRRGIR